MEDGGKLENCEMPFEARKFYNNSYYIYYTLKGDREKQYEFSQKSLKLLESNPHQIAENPYTYLSCLNNLLVVQLMMRKDEELPAYIEKMRTLAESLVGKKTQQFELMTFRYTVPLELEYYWARGEFQRAIKIIPSVEAGMKKFGKNITVRFRLFVSVIISRIYFGAGEYSTALRWLNTILNNSEIKIISRDDLYSFAKIFNLIIHYELGNRELVESAVRSTYRFLYKKERLFKTETFILNFIRKYSFVHNNEEMAAAFADLREQLLPLKEDTYEKNAFTPFDYVKWLEKKIDVLRKGG
jgi:tetratricopeptide (TPR) repeat protein